MNVSVAGRRLALAFLAAFALWTFVTITQNPEDHKTFDVPVQLQNRPNDLVVVDSDGVVLNNYGTIEVEVWAAINTLNQIRDGDLKAVVDLSKATATAEQLFPVTIVNTCTCEGYMSYKNDAQVKFRLDTMNTVELPIRIDMQNYMAASVAYDAPTGIIADAQTVTIRASQMRIKRIKEAKVTVQVANNFTARYENMVPVVVVDDADKPLDGMMLSPESVKVIVDVKPKTGVKKVVVLPQIRGYVAPGYQLREIRMNPAIVSINGGSEVVEQTQSIMTEPIDVSNLTESITKTVRLVLPDNILLLDDTATNNQTVSVGLKLELVVQPIRMRIPVEVTLADIPDGMNVSVVPNIVTVDVAASPATLQRGALTLVRAVAQVGAWDDNNRYRQVSLSLPADMQLVGNVPVVQLEVSDNQPPPPTMGITATPEEATSTAVATPTATLTVTPTKSTP